MKIYREGNYAVIDTGIQVYTAEITAADRSDIGTVQPYFATEGKVYPMVIGKYQIVPYGSENNLPGTIRELLDENNITPELLNKQTQLLWGQGPAMYIVKFENGKRVKYWEEDPEIKSWLKTWAWEDYLLKSMIEFRASNGHFTKYFRNRAVRIGGKGMIHHLENVSVAAARLEWPDKSDRIQAIITGDFDLVDLNSLRRYPVFDHQNPFQNPVAMRYSNLYSFALDNEYSRPSFYGAFNWIRLGSSIPKLLMYFNVNAANIRTHIKSPAIYWQQKREQFMKNCELKGIDFKEESFEDFKNEVFKKFAEGLVGLEKAGKFLTSETIWDPDGQEYVGWEIETIDQKVKNYISAQVEIAKRADFEITAGIGLHPALSNLSADGNLPSGSEQLYAFKLYLSTGVDIPESIVCKDINYALQINFPDKDYKIGFYHDTVTTEEMTTPSNRIKNQN